MAQKLTPEILVAALAGFEEQKNQIDSKIAEVRSMLDGGGHSEPTASTETAKPRKKFSAATRRKMALAQRARYSKLKGSGPMQAVTAKPKRKVSKAARKKMAAAQKARWAKIKKAA
jgi:peptidoglycan hydrolase CwlO-like protein